MRSNAKADLHIIDKPKKSCIGFTYISGKLWNMLPEDHRNIEDSDQFKTKIKPWENAKLRD